MQAERHWCLRVTHPKDGAYTCVDQRIEDDPLGDVQVVIAGKRKSDIVTISLGNAVAALLTDNQTPARELAKLHGGVGFFADVARLGSWLAAVDGPERRRRLAVASDPRWYRIVLPTGADCLSAGDEVTEQILASEPELGPQHADGLLHAVLSSTPEAARDHLRHLTDVIVCDPNTGSWWREQLVEGLIRAELSTGTHAEVLLACALRMITDDSVPYRINEYAEALLLGQEPL